MDNAELWNAYAWPEHCLRVNFVVSLNGHVKDASGLSGGLSDGDDRRIFHMLRAGCDAVLVGAGTVRAENYKPMRLQDEWTQFRTQKDPPPLIIVSASGNVPDVEGALTVDGTDLPALKRRYPRILCEGGPHLFASLLEQDLVDEIALSISGVIGGSAALLPRPVSAQFEPIHTHLGDESVFTLWSRA